MKKSYVYKITCKITGEFYFGSSFRAKSDYYWGSGRKIKDRIAKYGKENFIKEILGEFEDRTIAHQIENHYIEKFRNDDKCLNKHLDYHFGTYGEKSRAKLSAAKLGEHLSEEHKAKISAANRGKKGTMLGKHLSAATRAKISAANRGKNHPMYGKHWRKNPITGKREYYD